MFMKRTMWVIALWSAICLASALNGAIPVSGYQTDISLLSNSETGMSVEYSVGKLHLSDVKTPQGNFTQLALEGYTYTNHTGMPQLPLMRKIIRVPLEASVTARIVSSSNQTFSLNSNGVNARILPYQVSVAKNQDPATIPFAIDSNFYNGRSFTTEPTVKIEEIGMLRGTRLVALDFTPIQYNPYTAELQIITSATVEVNYAGADWQVTNEMYERYYSSAFEPMLAQTLFNYTEPRITLDRYPLGMIIIAPQSYVSTLQPFIDWKKQQGYNVTLATTEVTGTTTNAIKTYLQNIWNSATSTNPAPSYLLLVGDTAQIPAWTGTTSSAHVTDLNYVKLSGTDFVPEMYFGRFSAQNTTQVQTYVEKSLQYEMYTMPDPSYLSHTVLIAGVDATYGPTHANGQIRYGETNYFSESTAPDWNPYGPYQIRNHMYEYPASGSSDAAILAQMSAGSGFVNYTAHGSETSWADPTVTLANINALTNANKYFVAIGNCCLTNSFQVGECFGEAFTRIANKGAVAYIGGTNSTYWDEDYYWAVGYKPPVVSTGSPYIDNRIGAYDALFHYHNEAFADWASTLGSMTFMGNLAVVANNSQFVNYYWEIYSIMGDPSLIPYMGIPTVNAAEFPETVPLGMGTMQITAEPFTYVALSKDNVIHGVGLVDANGSLDLQFTPFESPGNAYLVMTRSLRQPLIETVEVIVNTGPYILVNGMTVNDGNNAVAESGETLYLDVVVNNVGTVNATNVTAVMTTDNPYVTILNGTANVGTVQINVPVTISNTFQIAISPAIPDQENIALNFAFSDGGTNNWSIDRVLTVNAPSVTFANPTFTDPNNNGSFEPGEIITVAINMTNTGHMTSAAGTLDIVISGTGATTPQTSFTLPGIPVGVNIPLSVPFTIAADAQNGTVIPIGLALTAGAQLVNGMVALPVGSTSEGFETGTIASPPWTNTSTIPWVISSGAGNTHSGTYSAKSGAIGHSGSTELSITMNVGLAGNISFWRRVSSESGYDKLKFFIDNTQAEEWSGEIAWGQETYPVTTGQHTFKWTYSKDDSVISGSDCGWIDDIVFPLSGDASIPLFHLPVTSLTFNDIELNVPVSQDLIVRNLGAADLTGSITVPALVNLLFNGAPVSDTYSYSIPAGNNGIFTIGLNLSETTNYNGNITITSNDVNNPSQTVQLHITTVANEDDTVIPTVTSLDGNYPNPFNPTTTIRFGVKEPGLVSINIYNLKGQLVRTLVDENKKAGFHSIAWNGIDNFGKSVSSGVYMYRMQTTGFHQTRKMMLMK
jgi:hypothetical protein